MKQKFTISKFNLLLVLILCLTGGQVFSQTTKPFSVNESPLPAPTSPVMDYAGVLDANTKQMLEKRVIEFRDKTNPKVELAVAIVKTTGERPIFEYSIAVARGWKIGSEETDNPSALLFIAVDDRKYFTQISKDLEDELPDGLAGQLQRQYLVPAFKQGDYGKGVSDTIEAYIRTIESKQTGQPNEPVAKTTNQEKKKRGAPSLYNIICCLVILFLIIMPILSRLGSGNKNSRGGRGRGGGGFGGGMGSWVLPVIVSGIANSGSSSSDWGGGSSSGGDSWGGFGGGGDFGGGGAGGDW